MKIGTVTTMDHAGRLVLPKAIREGAGLVPDTPLSISVDDGRILIEPAPLAVRLVRKGRLTVAVPLESVEPLLDDAVRERRHRREAIFPEAAGPSRYNLRLPGRAAGLPEAMRSSGKFQNFPGKS